MPDDTVPPIDPDLSPPTDGHRIRMAELEYERLSSEANMKKLANREVGQRYWIKWIAVALGFGTLLFMGALLWHALHQVFESPFNMMILSPAFLVVLVTAPVVSITTIVGAVFVGAFRQKDEGGAGANLAERASGAFDQFIGK